MSPASSASDSSATDSCYPSSEEDYVPSDSDVEAHDGQPGQWRDRTGEEAAARARRLELHRLHETRMETLGKTRAYVKYEYNVDAGNRTC